MKNNKIAICHFRVGGTDGVSLEIEKRKKILEENNCTVCLIAGPRSKNADFIIEELEWDDGIVPIIKENGYSYFNNNGLSDAELIDKMYTIADIIEKKLTTIQLKERFEKVLVHNIFSFGGHIAAARAFANWIEKFKLPTIATHHDFHWEREDFKITRNGLLKKYLESYMPPSSEYINHVVINSLAKDELQKRLGIKSKVIPDVFDFSQPKWETDSYNGDFLKHFDISPNDLVILQATRIIPRKGIEMAIDLVSELQKKVSQIKNSKLYNGKLLGSKPNVVLIIAGYAEDEKKDYLQKLTEKVSQLNIQAKFISDGVQAERSIQGGNKIYSLWDAYVFADLVTFPSTWEGWGNQFIEAIFAKKPIVVFEYPVFKKDIAKEGFQVVSLGDKFHKEEESGLMKIPRDTIKKAANKALGLLVDPQTNTLLSSNFALGKKHHSFDALESFLEDELAL